jgi:hypothetical protein
MWFASTCCYAYTLASGDRGTLRETPVRAESVPASELGLIGAVTHVEAVQHVAILDMVSSGHVCSGRSMIKIVEVKGKKNDED